MDFGTLLQILDSTLRLATPLLLACLAGLFSERAGIFDIGLEGKMLMAAMSSATVAALTGSVWIGLMAGIAGSMLFAAVHGVASITFRGNQLISGVALNFVASGITVLIAQDLFGQHDIPMKRLQHRLHGDRLFCLMPTIIIGHQRQGRVTELCLTGQFRFGHIGHPDYIDAPLPIEA